MNAASPVKPDHLALLLVLAVMTVLLLRQIDNPHLGLPDADRILMDGVFILDFLREMPLTRIYDFTINYFAQYPALSIGYRPPFFPFVEAVFNGIFGIHPWSSRLALLAFALVGVSAWFRLVQRVFDAHVAFWSSLLLVTTPFVARWGWYTMAEVPVLSMALLTGYLFYRFTETEQSRYLYATAFAFGLAVWTKQTAVFLALWLILYAALSGRLVAYLKRKDTWIAIAIAAAMVAPLAVITLWLGKMNLHQSVGEGGALRGDSRLTWKNLSVHLYTLGRFHLTSPVLLLSLIGIGWAGWRRDRRALYFGLLIVSTYAFFTYVAGKNPRYPIFWIPAFCVFAALPIVYLQKTRALVIGAALVLGGVTVYQVTEVRDKAPAFAEGYDAAARYVLTHSTSPTVFFDGYNNGYFTYFMRALDPQRSMYVLRGDKLLSSASITNYWMKTHAHSEEDIRKIFDRYGPHYIVVESDPWSGSPPIHQALREFLKSGPFELVHEIPIVTNRQPLEQKSLQIFEYLDAKAVTADFLELRLPVVGQTIRVPFRQQLQDGALLSAPQ